MKRKGKGRSDEGGGRELMQEYGYDTEREREREREGVVAFMKVQLSQLLCHFSDIFYTSL